MECTGVYQRALTETDFTFEVQCGVCFCAISLLTLALGLCRVCCSGCCLGQADMELLTQHLDPELRLKSRPKRHCVYVSDPWSPAFTEEEAVSPDTDPLKRTQTLIPGMSDMSELMQARRQQLSDSLDGLESDMDLDPHTDGSLYSAMERDRDRDHFLDTEYSAYTLESLVETTACATRATHASPVSHALPVSHVYTPRNVSVCMSMAKGDDT